MSSPAAADDHAPRSEDFDFLTAIWGADEAGWVWVHLSHGDKEQEGWLRVDQAIEGLPRRLALGRTVAVRLPMHHAKNGSGRLGAVAVQGSRHDLLACDLPPSYVVDDEDDPDYTVGIWVLRTWEGRSRAAEVAQAISANVDGPLAPVRHDTLVWLQAPPHPAAEIGTGSRYTVEDLLALDDAETRRAEVARRIRNKRIDAEAQRLLVRSTFTPPPSSFTLADAVQHDGPIAWAIEDLHPAGTNALLIAQYKTGKSTLALNWAAAFADDEPFLGEHNVAPLDLGRVAIWNYEMTEAQFNSWAQRRIAHTEQASVLSLRGQRLRLTNEAAAAWAVGWLAERQVRDLVIDVFSRSYGANENDNSAVGEFLEVLDWIKQEAGVENLLLVTHTGRKEHEEGQEHARGATRLDDWADVRMTLTKDNAGNRFLRCNGRDVDLPERRLTFDSETLRLGYAEGERTDRASTRQSTALDAAKGSILEALRDSPGIKAGDLRSISRVRDKDFFTARRELVAEGLIVQRREGTSVLLHLADPRDENDA